MVVASLIGLLHNSVRNRPMPLFPHTHSGASSYEAASEDPRSGQDLSKHDPGTESEQIPSSPTEGSSADLVTIEQVKAYTEDPDVFILDARSEAVFNKGHIPGSFNVPYDKFVEFYDFIQGTIPIKATVICYCWGPTCDFSDHLAEELRIIGYENVKIFREGWEAWEEAGYSVEKQ